jgi:ABC-type dipeptide/oligopeptide/nickel transport system permease subunit
MIAENRSFISLQPWTVAAPALCIALFTITVNVIADGFVRLRDRSG